MKFVFEGKLIKIKRRYPRGRQERNDNYKFSVIFFIVFVGKEGFLHLFKPLPLLYVGKREIKQNKQMMLLWPKFLCCNEA